MVMASVVRKKRGRSAMNYPKFYFYFTMDRGFLSKKGAETCVGGKFYGIIVASKLGNP